MKIVKKDVRLIQMCIVVSIFSQIEPLSSIFRPLMYSAWIITIAYYILTNVRHLVLQKYTKIYLLSYSILIVMCMLITMFGQNHMNGNYIHIMAIPLLVTIVGGFFGSCMSNDGLQKVLKTYLICAVFYAVWAHVTYYASYSNWLKQTMYTFLQKNSAAQIWAAGILMALLVIDYKSMLEKVIGYMSASYLIVICGMSQCRTALLAMAVVVCAYILLRSKHKLRWIAIMVAGCVFAWNFSVTRKFIDQALFLTKYAGADLNAFSSGRLGHWERAIETFKANFFFGSGQYYVDCSYLCVLAEIGLVGFILVETIWFTRIAFNFANRNSESRDFLFCATVFYLVESVLEGYPPFGPGTSSFMFWFLSSVFSSRKIDARNGLLEK